MFAGPRQPNHEIFLMEFSIDENDECACYYSAENQLVKINNVNYTILRTLLADMSGFSIKTLEPNESPAFFLNISEEALRQKKTILTINEILSDEALKPLKTELIRRINSHFAALSAQAASEEIGVESAAAASAFQAGLHAKPALSYSQIISLNGGELLPGSPALLSNPAKAEYPPTPEPPYLEKVFVKRVYAQNYSPEQFLQICNFLKTVSGISITILEKNRCFDIVIHTEKLPTLSEIQTMLSGSSSLISQDPSLNNLIKSLHVESIKNTQFYTSLHPDDDRVPLMLFSFTMIEKTVLYDYYDNTTRELKQIGTVDYDVWSLLDDFSSGFSVATQVDITPTHSKQYWWVLEISKEALLNDANRQKVISDICYVSDNYPALKSMMEALKKNVQNAHILMTGKRKSFENLQITIPPYDGPGFSR